MDNEPYRDLSHTEALQFLAAAYTERNHKVATEVTLPNKRRADILMVNPFGLYEIIEIKTAFTSHLLGEALNKYGPWCHALHVAVTGLSDRQIRADEALPRWRHHFERVGLIGVYPCSFVRHRPAAQQPLHPKICDILATLLANHAAER
jgi:hypothetical protein